MGQSVTLSIREAVGVLTFDRGPENTLTPQVVDEFGDAIAECEGRCVAVVVEGRPDVFCTGADFAQNADVDNADYDPEPLYQVWHRLAEGPFVSISHVRGRASAGGVGFVASSDIVIASSESTYALPELLFGLMPVMVLPFLIRRIGHQRASYLSLTTKPVTAETALTWGLADEVGYNSSAALARCLKRVSKIPLESVRQYKNYMSGQFTNLGTAKDRAVTINRSMFADPRVQARISQFVDHGLMPWENSQALADPRLFPPEGGRFGA